MCITHTNRNAIDANSQNGNFSEYNILAVHRMVYSSVKQSASKNVWLQESSFWQNYYPNLSSPGMTHFQVNTESTHERQRLRTATGVEQQTTRDVRNELLIVL